MKNADILTSIAEQLNSLRLFSAEDTLKKLYQSPAFTEMSSLDVLNKIVNSQYTSKSTAIYNTHLKASRLIGCNAMITNCIDSNQRVYTPNGTVERLRLLDFISHGDNVCILGSSNSGKSYLAKAIGIEACRKFTVLYCHAGEYIEQMVNLKTMDYIKFRKKEGQYLSADLLILDDFCLNKVADEAELKLLFEIFELRSENRKSIIVCSQREPSGWAAMLNNDKVYCDAIIKRATRDYTLLISTPEDRENEGS